MSINKIIKQRRVELGFTAKHVAHQVGVSSSTYFEWEQGRKISGEDYYISLCETLNLSLTKLITEKDEKEELIATICEIEGSVKKLKYLL